MFFFKKKHSLLPWWKMSYNNFLGFFPQTSGCHVGGKITWGKKKFEFFQQTLGCHVFEMGENQFKNLKNLIMNLYA